LGEENFQHFSEKVVWLPHCCQPNDSRRKVLAEIPSRAACGLPQTGFVFCCFNNPFKILPEVFDVWMRLLREVPDSVLWLLQSDQTGQENLLREAGSRGVDESRLKCFQMISILPGLPAQICSSTRCLITPIRWRATRSGRGVQVITCTGRTFTGRVATSLLHNVGFPELAVSSLREYERLALRLARGPNSAAALKQELLARRSTAPLFDTPRLAREIESAYREMLRRADQGLAPEFFDVRALAN
jgi:protein O-GlcNAc transferase